MDNTEVFSKFRGYSKILDGDDDVPFYKIAISIFDRWLGPDINLLDCTPQEREVRNQRLQAFCKLLFKNTEIFSISKRFGSEAPENFVKYTVEEIFLEDCRYDANKTSDEFHFLFLPKYSAIYHENWDDTNILWHRDPEIIQPVLVLARECGLHTIEFAV